MNIRQLQFGQERGEELLTVHAFSEYWAIREEDVRFIFERQEAGWTCDMWNGTYAITHPCQFAAAFPTVQAMWNECWSGRMYFHHCYETVELRPFIGGVHLEGVQLSKNYKNFIPDDPLITIFKTDDLVYVVPASAFVCRLQNVGTRYVMNDQTTGRELTELTDHDSAIEAAGPFLKDLEAAKVKVLCWLYAVDCARQAISIASAPQEVPA